MSVCRASWLLPPWIFKKKVLKCLQYSAIRLYVYQDLGWWDIVDMYRVSLFFAKTGFLHLSFLLQEFSLS